MSRQSSAVNANIHDKAHAVCRGHGAVPWRLTQLGDVALACLVTGGRRGEKCMLVQNGREGRKSRGKRGDRKVGREQASPVPQGHGSNS